MLFKSKYIFETRKTKIKRFLTNGLIFVFIIGIIFLLNGYYFINHAKNEKIKSQEKLFQKLPDVIVIFTGQKGRIPYGLKKGQKYNQTNIFITGVHARNNVKTLTKDLTLSSEINPDQLEIDYLARNTVENVLATIRYIRSNEAIKNVLIISHDYHITRIKAIFDHLKQKSDTFEIYYDGKELDYSKLENLKILYKEVFKYFRTTLFLMLWDV